MKKIAISMPVHQAPLCIENQLQNIQKFVPNSVVVLHVSGSSHGLKEQVMHFAHKYTGFLFINPTSYNTYDPNEAAQVTGLSTVHASNIRYLASVLQFDTVAFETSNDFFVRKGIEHTFNAFDCGAGVQKTPVEDFRQRFPGTIEYLSKVIDFKYAEKAAQEGMWFPKEVAIFVADKILELMAIHGIQQMAAEEATLANFAFNGFPGLYESNAGTHYVYHNAAEAACDRGMIHSVRNGDLPHVYSVKRIPRGMHDHTRQFVNALTKND